MMPPKPRRVKALYNTRYTPETKALWVRMAPFRMRRQKRDLIVALAAKHSVSISFMLNILLDIGLKAQTPGQIATVATSTPDEENTSCQTPISKT